MAKEGVTIFLSSHLLTEIAKIADQIGIIHQGVLISEIRSNRLMDLLHKRLIIDTSDNIKTLNILSTNHCKPQINLQGEIELTDIESLQNPGKIASKIMEQGMDLRKMYPWQEDLESYFLRMITNRKDE